MAEYIVTDIETDDTKEIIRANTIEEAIDLLLNGPEFKEFPRRIFNVTKSTSADAATISIGLPYGERYRYDIGVLE